MKQEPLNPDEDIRADIQAAFDGASTAEASSEEQVGAPVVEEAPERSEKTEKQDDGRARDESGRFVAKPEEVVQDNGNPLPQTEESQPGTIRPPVSWSATAKADFAKLPEHIQKEVLKREKDMENGLAQWAPKGERLNKFEALFAPRKEKLALAGVDEFRAIEQLLAAQDFLERDPHGALQYLAQQYGVSLQGQTQVGAQPQPQPQQSDPRLTELQQQVATLTQTLTSQRQADEQKQAEAAKSEWMAFRSDPANLYAENVKEDMAILLREGRATDLQTAYDMAIWANPETRKLMMASVPAAQPAPKEVKPAGLSVTGAPGLGSVPATPSNARASVEEDVRAAISQLTGRVV